MIVKPPTCFADWSKSDFLNNPRSISCRFHYHPEQEENDCIICTPSKANYCTGGPVHIQGTNQKQERNLNTVVAVQSAGRAGNQKNEPKKHKLKPHHKMSEGIERGSNSEIKQFTSILMGLMRCSYNLKYLQDPIYTV